MSIEIAILNSMASPDFETSLERQAAWGLKLLDLKDGILGKRLLDLTPDEAARAAAMVRDSGLSVYCLSSPLFHADVEQGRERFTEGLAARVQHLVALAGVFRTQVVRLLGATTSRRDEVVDAVADVERRHPWLIEEYRRAIDRIADAGFTATIENETHGCILSTPAEVRRLFALIDRPGRVMFTWDVQNMWQAGTWPTAAVYEELRDLTGYVHLKGGQSADPGGPLQYRCCLEDSSYDVRGIVRDVVASGRVEVICLNPPHGRPRPEGDDPGRLVQDIEFTRRLIGEYGSAGGRSSR